MENSHPPDDALSAMENADGEAIPFHVLRLYVAGPTPQSTRAIVNTRKICEQYLKNRYSLEVVDIRARPETARGDQIIAVPTLVKASPLPLRRFIGDLSNTSRILAGMNLEESPASSTPAREI